MADDPHDDDVHGGTDRIERVVREALANFADRARVVTRLSSDSHSPSAEECARLREARIERDGAFEECNAFGVSAEVLLGRDDGAKVTNGFGVVRIESERAM